ncbi:MAG: hypothetical protein ACI4VQ_06465 [Clostridia bacterium]
MKKGIFSVILLVMALVLTMTITACVSDTQAATSEAKIIGTVVEQLPSVPQHECKVEYLNSGEKDGNSPIPKMTSEEISDYLAEMVHISQTETLCWSCMDIMGLNFYDIWRLNSSACNRAEFETQASVAFDNIFRQASAKQIPVDFFSSWEAVPVAYVQCRYFSSTSFSSTDYLCPNIDELTEEDSIRVAKVFFANPVFANNYWFATEILKTSSSKALTDMAWEHLIALSKSADPTLFGDISTYFTCLHLLGQPELLSNTSKITEIAENILQNPNYNFIAKYVFLCSDFCYNSDLDKEICDMAFEHLLELAQDADEETYKLVVEVAIELYNKYELDSQAVEDLRDKYDVDLLVSYLMDWKEVANTRLPSVY